MVDTTTSAFELVKVEVGASRNTWGEKLNTNSDWIDAVLLGLYTYGGTPDVVTITTGLTLSNLNAGMTIRFLATATNTTGITINVDAIGAVTAKTITGAALPAGYIRIGTYTNAVYDGVNWIVDRQSETGEPLAGINGRFIKEASGAMTCIHKRTETTLPINVADGTIFRSANRAWTFPATFFAQPPVFATCDSQQYWVATGAGGVTPTDYNHFIMSATTVASMTMDVELCAIGRWY